MTVALMMIPAAAARFWSAGYAGQAGAAILISALASGAGLTVSARLGGEPGAVMTLCAAALFGFCALVGPNGGLIQTLAARRSLH
jgi:ABC-type Mn2+/Zn2+ transport system permease subunit